MNAFRFPFALIGFLGFVLVAPGWMYFVYEYASLGVESQFLASMVLPALALLYLVSWVQPRSG